MLPLWRFIKGIRDDRGVRHVFAISTSQDLPAGRRVALDRIFAELQPDKTLQGLRTAGCVLPLAFVFTLMLLPILGAMSRVLGISEQFALRFLPFMPLVLPLIVTSLVIAFPKGRYQRVAWVAVEEGLCGACGFDIRTTPVQSDGCLICPECAAAWQASRRRASLTSNDAPTPSASPRHAGALTRLTRPLRLTTVPTIRDRRGRTFQLIESRDVFSRVANSAPEDARRFTEASHKLRSLGLLSRASKLIALLACCAYALYLGFLSERSASLPDAHGRRIAYIVLVSILLPTGLFIFFGRDCAPKRKAIAALLLRRLCPSCGARLDDLQPASDGFIECPECSAAWSLPVTVTIENDDQPRCPRCKARVTSPLINDAAEIACAKCGHWLTSA